MIFNTNVTLRSQGLGSRDLSISSYYQAKILYISTSSLFSLSSISPPLQPFFHPCINSDTTFSTNQHQFSLEKKFYMSLSHCQSSKNAWAQAHWKTTCKWTPFQSGGNGARGIISNSTKESHQWGAMVNGKRNNLLDAAGLTFGTSTSASTGVGYLAVSLVAMPRKKV